MGARATTLNVLLAGVAKGDRAAFERLYRQTAPRLYGVCLGVLRRPDLAEEVLQEVYVQIWREAPQFATRVSNPMGWMGVMARHRAIDVLRRGGHEVHAFEGDDAHGAASDPVDDPSERVARQLDDAALRDCLGKLGPERREAILLAFFHGMSHRELSQSLAQPAGTVKSWIRRGLAQLRRCLER